MKSVSLDKVSFVDEKGQPIPELKEAMKETAKPELPEGCIEDINCKGSVLSMDNDYDKITNAINALGLLFKGVYSGALAMSNGRTQKLEKKLGMKLSDVETHATQLISDIRLLTYGLRGGDNPYAEIWKDYLAIKDGTFDPIARKHQKEDEAKKANEEFIAKVDAHAKRADTNTVSIIRK